MASHGEVSTMKMLIAIQSVQYRDRDLLLWVVALLIGTAFLWPLLFSAYLWAVFMGKL
jgi:hypothetical protein